MLQHLRIHDFAIIDAVDLEFPAGFTVITGETGAGKSILVNALTLILGGRASTNVIRAGAKNAQVEALFDVSAHPVVRARLEERELVGDDVDALLVRRVIAHKGRGKVIINGQLSTVATLAEIVRGLVDISGQHDQQSLLVVESHLEILDTYADNGALRSEYRDTYERLRQLSAEKEALMRNEEENLARADYLRFQLEEIEQIAPRAGEAEELEVERMRLGHAEKLKEGAQLAESLLYSEDGSAFDKLGKAVAEVEALVRIDSELSATCDALNGARREIEEAARELQHYADGIESDPRRLDEVESRVAELMRLGRKHGGSVAEILVHQERIAHELDGLGNAEERLLQLDAQIEEQRRTAVELVRELSETRRAAASRLQEAVRRELGEMDLAGAVFCAEIRPRRPSADAIALGSTHIGYSGGDEVELLWSANPGEPPRPLAKIVSGGELSRLMLAVKSVLSNRDLVSLYVFDEVDTGLGGRAADSIGRKIKKVAERHQAITITHLAPIAARADYHLRVSKSAHKDRTVSSFVSIDGDTRQEEIARMIDGAEITKATRQAAREMLARSASA